jgi:hypothetical protein
MRSFGDDPVLNVRADEFGEITVVRPLVKAARLVVLPTHASNLSLIVTDGEDAEIGDAISRRATGQGFGVWGRALGRSHFAAHDKGGVIM